MATAIALADFRAEHFEPLLNRSFRLRSNDAPPGQEPSELVLIEVNRFENAEDFPGRPPFSLIFELRGGRPLARGTSRLLSTDFEECDLLITLIWSRKLQRQNPKGMFYEVVFA